VTYLHPDHLGTPKFGTNAGGTQVWGWAPDAFGNGSPSGAATVNLRMPGQYFDAESGLFYNWNRYYNPATGRYISSDPIGLEGGINTFLYAVASPVMMIDPEGLYSWWDFQGDVADGAVEALNGLAGVTDALTFGQSRRYRQEQGLEYADTCSTAYQIGDWTGTGLEVLAGGKIALSKSSPLFKRKVGLLNNNDYLRIGWGWNGTKQTGGDVFRIAIGSKKSGIHKHIDIWGP